eukprot:gene1900-55623_t
MRAAWGIAGTIDQPQDFSAYHDHQHHDKLTTTSHRMTGASHATVAAGVCTGHLLCGDIGCAGLLRYSFVGEAAAWVHAVERLATRRQLVWEVMRPWQELEGGEWSHHPDLGGKEWSHHPDLGGKEWSHHPDLGGKEEPSPRPGGQGG